MLAHKAKILQIKANVAFVHVKAHQGHPWNEAADVLAKWVTTANPWMPDCQEAIIADGFAMKQAWQWKFI